MEQHVRVSPPIFTQVWTRRLLRSVETLYLLPLRGCGRRNLLFPPRVFNVRVKRLTFLKILARREVGPQTLLLNIVWAEVQHMSSPNLHAPESAGYSDFPMIFREFLRSLGASLTVRILKFNSDWTFLLVSNIVWH